MKSGAFVKILEENGYGPYMGVPCSYLKHLIACLNDTMPNDHFVCASEGEALGLSAGFALSKKKPVVYMQNDGYGNAVNPLSSLQLIYKLPSLLLITWRGEPSVNDAEQHSIMGSRMLELLNSFEIPYIVLQDNDIYFEESVHKATEHIRSNSTPFAFILKKGFFDKYENDSMNNSLINHEPMRLDYIKLLKEGIRSCDILLGGTGFTGRELEQYCDHKGKFYMMGSMGCLPSIGMGLAISNPERRIYVLDGDGAILMKLGSLSTIGFYKPKNLIHICFDNKHYESTGNQKTTSIGDNFINVAKSCGYQTVSNINDIESFGLLLEEIDSYNNPHFIHINVLSGTSKDLSRPESSAVEMKKRLMEFLVE